MPPPKSPPTPLSVFPERVISASVKVPALKMPPPLAADLPPLMVRLLILTVPELILNTRLALLPLIVNAPFPALTVLLIVRFLLIANSPVVSVMVCGPAPRLKSIVAVAQASRIACRSVPAPLSAVLVTVIAVWQLITVCDTVLLVLLLKFPSPLYKAVIACGEPAGVKADVWHVALAVPLP